MVTSIHKKVKDKRALSYLQQSRQVSKSGLISHLPQEVLTFYLAQ